MTCQDEEIQLESLINVLGLVGSFRERNTIF